MLTHLEHDQPPREATVLRDFSDTLDFLTPPPADDTPGAAGGDVTATGTEAGTPGDPEITSGEDTDEEECTVIHVADMGPEMQDAWRRLRLSRPFRPLQYLAWEQPGVAPFPELRVHDLEPVFTEDPWLHLRDPATAAEEDGQLADGSAGGLFSVQQANDSPPGFFATQEPDAEDAGMGPLPSPIQYFQLDGAVQLVRTRFLHLALDLEWREPVFEPAPFPVESAPRDSAGGPPDRDTAPQPTSFLIQRLEQRRQVRSGRMEYFDGPVLSVLALITDISDTVAGAGLDP